MYTCTNMCPHAQKQNVMYAGRSLVLQGCGHMEQIIAYKLSKTGIFRLFDGPQGHSWDLSKFAEKSCIYVHYNCKLLMLCSPSCPPFYPDSVCPELVWRHAVWKWTSVPIYAFCGALQATLWQVKIGLLSFVTQFWQAAHRLAGENLFALWEVRLKVLGLRVCKYVWNKSDRSSHVDIYVFTLEVISGKTF